VIALENVSRTQKTFNLTARIAPLRRVHKRATTDRDGRTRIDDRRLVYPDSITILAGATSKDLPDSYEHAPEVAKAIARGDVKVHRREATADEPATSGPEAEGAQQAPRSRRRNQGGEG